MFRNLPMGVTKKFYANSIRVIAFPTTNYLGEYGLNADEQFGLKGAEFKDIQHPNKKLSDSF